MCDIILRVYPGDDASADGTPACQDFEAHKCVLAGYPSFLSAMLQSPMMEVRGFA